MEFRPYQKEIINEGSKKLFTNIHRKGDYEDK